ncbi:hypothetical protein GQ457_09G031250 [Hibiscus cannabinus]
MKLMSWNIRGIGSELKVSELRRVIRVHKVDLVFIQEPKKEVVKEDLIRKIWYDDDFDFRFSGAEGKAGGLFSVWNSKAFELNTCLITRNTIFLEGRIAASNLHCTLINVYASKKKRNRSERSGCSTRQTGSLEFNSFIKKCKLLDIPLTGRKFTWFGNGAKRSRLDRILVDEEWA